MTNREKLIKRMADAIMDSIDDFRLPRNHAVIMAEAALRVIETPKDSRTHEIKPCTCGHNGYGKHMVGCELYA